MKIIVLVSVASGPASEEVSVGQKPPSLSLSLSPLSLLLADRPRRMGRTVDVAVITRSVPKLDRYTISTTNFRSFQNRFSSLINLSAPPLSIIGHDDLISGDGEGGEIIDSSQISPSLVFAPFPNFHATLNSSDKGPSCHEIAPPHKR